MSDQGINWGSVIKGAAIAVAAVAVVSFMAPAGGAIATWMAANATLAYGSAAVAGGVMAHSVEKAQAREEQHIENQSRNMERESFAARLDMERMQGLMVARRNAVMGGEAGVARG